MSEMESDSQNTPDYALLQVIWLGFGWMLLPSIRVQEQVFRPYAHHSSKHHLAKT
jgi:hypothetical protein